MHTNSWGAFEHKLCLTILFPLDRCKQLIRRFDAERWFSVQEEMYSYVTVADDQTTKGKGTVIVDES